jgi:hypothetical protein
MEWNEMELYVIAIGSVAESRAEAWRNRER